MKSKLQILALALLLSLVTVIPAGCGSGQTDENKTPTESGITESLEERSESGEPSSSSTPTEKSTPEAPSTPSADENSKLQSEISISSSGYAEEQVPENHEVSEESSDQSSKQSSSAEGSNSVSETDESGPKASEVITVKQESSDSVSKTESKSPESSEVSVEKQESSNSVSKPESAPSVPARPSDIPVAADSVKLNVHDLSLTIGDSFQLTATIFPTDTNDQQLTWYWSDKSVVTINEQSVITAVGAGTATITVRTNNGKQDICNVTVKAKEQPKPVEISIQESSKPVETSKPTEPSKQESSTLTNPILAAYTAPYDWDAVIDDLRQIGEQQYGMTWEDSLWVRNRGHEYGSRFDEQYGFDVEDGFYHGNCQFGFPVTNTESEDGERLRNSCLYMFTLLERKTNGFGGSMQNWYFKIVVEDVGINDNGKQEYWIYLLHT